MDANIETFLRKTSMIIENDYGDFMRTENLYLNHLIRNLGLYGDRNINAKLAEMQTYLQFTPNWDVDSTRERLVNDAHYLDDLVQAHRQDWESQAM